MTTRQDAETSRRLAAWLAERRWYGEKGRQLTGVETMFFASADIAGESLSLEVLRLSFSGGADADYLLIQDPRNPQEDGIESERVRRWLIDGFAEQRNVVAGDESSLMFNAEPAAENVNGLGEIPSRVFRGEQSNSSIVFGERAILKLFRKLRKGINPEVEIGTFLTRHSEFRAFPQLLGTIDLKQGDQMTTVAALQQFIPSVGDAWSWITDRITDKSVRPTTVDSAHQLGVRTGELHRAFASGKDEAFAPERASATYAEAVRAEAGHELRDTIEQLQQRGVGGVAVLGDSLEASLDALRHLEGTNITRIHGDYHLGQVLRTKAEDFAILDFEGEPTRALSERRAKASPLRDVAGMLRSFDYAAETARRTVGGGEPRAIDAWYEASRSAFMQGYNETVADDETLMQGWNPISRQAVLSALEVHKALYETRYELGNRPDWLDIPLDALRRIARDTS